jgi:hypothetical protein
MENSTIKTRGADTALKIQKLLKALIECMEAETTALRDSDQKKAIKISAEKIHLAQTYKAIALELRANPTLLKDADGDIKAQLFDLIKKFDSSLKDNRTVIETGKNAVSRIINRLLTKAREAADRGTKNYNAKGRLIEQKMTTMAMPTHLNDVY